MRKPFVILCYVHLGLFMPYFLGIKTIISKHFHLFTGKSSETSRQGYFEYTLNSFIEV